MPPRQSRKPAKSGAQTNDEAKTAVRPLVTKPRPRSNSKKTAKSDLKEAAEKTEFVQSLLVNFMSSEKDDDYAIGEMTKKLKFEPISNFVDFDPKKVIYFQRF
jgi:hypothetical protein